MEYSWYSFLLEAESNPGLYCGRNRTRDLPVCNAVPKPTALPCAPTSKFAADQIFLQCLRQMIIARRWTSFIWWEEVWLHYLPQCMPYKLISWSTLLNLPQDNNSKLQTFKVKIAALILSFFSKVLQSTSNQFLWISIYPSLIWYWKWIRITQGLKLSSFISSIPDKMT